MKKIIVGVLMIIYISVSNAQVPASKVIIHIGGRVFSINGDINLGSLDNSQIITQGDSTITKLPNIIIITNPKRHTKEIYINGGSEDFSYGFGGNYYMDLNRRVDSMLNNPQGWGMSMPNFSLNWGNGNFPGNIDSMMTLNRKWIDSMTHRNWTRNENMPRQYYYYYNNKDEDADTSTTKERLQEKVEDMQDRLNDMQDKLNDLNEQLKEQEQEQGKAKGQNSSSVQVDTTRVRVGNLRIIINHNGVQINPHDTSATGSPSYTRSAITTHWILLDVGFDTYLNNFSTNLPAGYSGLELIQGKSANVNLHLFQQTLNLYNGHLFFAYGVSFEFNNYRFRQNTTLAPKSDTVKFTEASTTLSKNKLSDTYLTVPILFQYESNTNFSKSFRVGLGINVGYLIASHTKQVSDEYGKVKVWDNFDLNTFRYGPTLRIGFSWFNLYANYSLNGLFRTGSAPELNPFSFGISIIAD